MRWRNHEILLQVSRNYGDDYSWHRLDEVMCDFALMKNKFVRLKKISYFCIVEKNLDDFKDFFNNDADNSEKPESG